MGRVAVLVTALLVVAGMSWSGRVIAQGAVSQGAVSQGAPTPAVTLTLVETDPALPATLVRWQLLALRIHYDTDQPIRIRARGSVAGTDAPIENGGSLTYDAGSGDALFWFRTGDTTRFDRMTIEAEAEGTGRVVARLVVPLDAHWTGVAAAAPPEADWVKAMLADRAARQQTDYTRMMARSSTGITTRLVPLLGASVIAYLVLQIVTLVRYRGRRRRLALIPLIPMGLVIIYTLVALGHGSNLFPLVLLFTAPFGALYLLALMLSARSTARFDERR